MKTIEKFKRSNRKTELTLCIVLVFSVALLIFVLSTRQKDTSDQPKPEEITHSTDTPDESLENAQGYQWQGGPNDPERIVINQIGADSFIQRAGVDQDNKVAVPNNVHLAGWFTQSMQPGQMGLSIIAAHVSGRSTDGLFKHLGKLVKGDEFTVERGDGVMLRYQVIGTVTLPESESASVLFSQDPKVKSQLNLVTCGGNFNRTVNQYEDRVIVSAKLL